MKVKAGDSGEFSYACAVNLTEKKSAENQKKMSSTDQSTEFFHFFITNINLGVIMIKKCIMSCQETESTDLSTFFPLYYFKISEIT